MPNSEFRADEFAAEQREAKQHTNDGNGSLGESTAVVQPLNQQVQRGDCSADVVQREVAAEHCLGNQAVGWRWGKCLHLGGEKHRGGEKRKEDRAAHPHAGIEQTHESQESRHAAI